MRRQASTCSQMRCDVDFNRARTATASAPPPRHLSSPCFRSPPSTLIDGAGPACDDPPPPLRNTATHIRDHAAPRGQQQQKRRGRGGVAKGRLRFLLCLFLAFLSINIAEAGVDFRFILDFARENQAPASAGQNSRRFSTGKNKVWLEKKKNLLRVDRSVVCHTLFFYTVCVFEPGSALARVLPTTLVYNRLTFDSRLHVHTHTHTLAAS